MLRAIPALALLVACAPATGSVDPVETRVDPEDPRPSGCSQGPADLAVLDEVPVTVFYEGPFYPLDGAFGGPTIAIETPVQREWGVWTRDWLPEGEDPGNLDDDPENAGHGVLLGAYRSSTCGLEVVDISAWALGDEAGTTHVELVVEDSSGGCADVCDMTQWVGVAAAVPIADFPFSGPISTCIVVEDACG
jgi:hypothetical protein